MNVLEAVYFGVCVSVAVYGCAMALYAHRFTRISMDDMKPKHPCPPEENEK